MGSLRLAASALVRQAPAGRLDVDVLSLTAWQMAIGSISLVAIAVPTHGGAQWTPSFVAPLAYTVLLANMLAWTLWLFALRSLPAGLGRLAVPVVGVLAAW